MQKIIPFLWFDNQAEEAVNFYVTVFKNAKIGKVTRYDDASAKASGRPAGSVMTIGFELEDQQFCALNGGPVFQFTPAVSFLVACNSQEEIDNLWEKLSAHKEAEQCGWLKDKFGVSWQIVPAVLNDMLQDPDHEKASRVAKALINMKKIDLAELKRAYEGK